MTVTSGASATLEEDRLAVDDEPAAGIGRALRNLAPKLCLLGERFVGNHKKYSFLTPDWPAP